jgi:MoaA/NifB/PqqE/SkfB family radical SAM enzyme
MMNEEKENKVTFGWDVCHSCNYRCPYCGVWHDQENGELLLSVQEWAQIWERLGARYGSCHIYMSGGEPSTYPDFMGLVRVLTQRHSVEICTNLSWDPTGLTRSILPGVLRIAPTFHPSFADFDEFFAKVVAVKAYLPNAQIYYVAYPQQIKDMPGRSRRLKEQGIALIPLPLRGDGYVLNSEDEKRIVAEISPYRGDKIGYQLQQLSPKGKRCRAGARYCVIRVDGSVDRCSQYRTGSVGNIADRDFELLPAPLACEKEYCPIESQWILD